MTAILRWWWIRHAPIAEAGGRWIGRTDAGCGAIDPAKAAALAAILPARAVWLASGYRRTRETAAALRAFLPDAPEPIAEPGFAEQDFGEWDGERYDDLGRLPPSQGGEAYWRFWDHPATARPPGGESFVEAAARIAAAIEVQASRYRGTGGDLVVVAHAGTIRAALAAALDLPAERALSFEIAPLSLTRIDYHPASCGGSRDGGGEILTNGLSWAGRQIVSSNRTFP